MEIKPKQGETPIEGETSKKENDQPVETGQENVQSNNSDANDAPTEDAKTFSKGFMDKLTELIQSGYTVEQIDNAICKVVNSWANKPTKEAGKFLKKGYSKYRYIGRKLGQAAVPYDTGLNYLKKKYSDETSDVIENEYKQGYGEIDFDENYRKNITKNLRP